MLKEYFAPKLLRNPWTQCALAGIHLIHFREQKLCCRICSNHLVGCRFPHQASSVSWNLRSEWHLSTNLAMQIVNCAPWSPTLQCRHGCMSPSCGKGRMHSGGEHEWQIQRPHLRQWCFLKQSSRKRIWLTPSKVTNNLSDGHGVKMMIGHESKKVLSTPCSLRRKRQSFLPSFLPSQFAAPQKQPEVSLTYLTQLQLRLQIGNEVPVKQHERKCYYINLYHLHIYPALSLGPFDLLGCLKFWSAMLFWVPNLLKYRLAIASPAHFARNLRTSYHPHCFWRRNQFQLEESSTSTRHETTWETDVKPPAPCTAGNARHRST